MTVNIDDVKKIRKKIEGLKQRKAKAQGAMENIEKRWKQEFNCSTQEEVEARIQEIEEDISRREKRLEILMDKVEKAYDWEEV